MATVHVVVDDDDQADLICNDVVNQEGDGPERDQKPFRLPRVEDNSQMKSLPAVVVALIGNFLMVLLVFVLPVVCTGGKCGRIDSFSVLIYFHSLYWIVHLVVDQYLKFKHRESRQRGFFDFYVATKNLRRTPFYIISFANCLLLLTVIGLHDFCDNSSNPTACKGRSVQIECLRGLMTVECMIISYMWAKYVVTVRRFNQDGCRVPDVIRPDYVLGSCPATAQSQAFATAEEPRIQMLERQSEILYHICNLMKADGEGQQA